MPERITVALAGNPNSGKTTIFNNLTGARQHVGNYPGVTVEKKEGRCTHNGVEINIIDLPGTYSLTAHSVEELIARNFVIEEKPDVVVDILDASNLERNLYLATQFMEVGVPLVLALNMSDLAEARGHVIETNKLSELLGVRMVPTVGHKRKGMKELLDAAVEVARSKDASQSVKIHYGREIEEEIARLEGQLEPAKELTEKYGSRWLAVKLLENDAEIERTVREVSSVHSDDVLSAAERSRKHLQGIFGDYSEIVIAERRYGFISGACQEAVKTTVETRHTTSDRIDQVVTNRILGLPIFAIMMYLVFQLTFTLGDPPMGWIETAFGWLASVISGLWPKGAESVLKSLLVDGIIGGVGGVIIFLPNILLLFLAIAFLEDTGYMARAAFVMDRLMHKIGLHGKSFIPMLLGFGCSIPGIMATRTLESRRDRLTTMLVLPLMSCGARLPIYALIIPAFFANRVLVDLGILKVRTHGFLLWTIYIIGVALAVMSAKILRASLLKGEATPLVMELPPYRMPTVKGILIHMWERGWLFLRKAGTIILAVSIILWACTTFPRKTELDRDYDARLEKVQRTFRSGLKALNADLGLAPSSETLTAFLKAEEEMAAEQEMYYETEDEFRKAEERKDQAIKQLSKNEDFSTVSRFIRIRDEVLRLRQEFESATEEIGEGTPQEIAAERHLEEQLSMLELSDPKIYGVVLKYLDDLRAPADEERRKIEQERKAEVLAYSAAGRIGHALEPVLRPLGFDWRIGTALIGAFAAKEVFVAQMGIVYSVGEADEGSESLREKLQQNYTPLIGFCIMLFSLVSAPCMATIAVTKRESNSWRWALLQLGGLTAMAYILTLVVYQVGRLFAGT